MRANLRVEGVDETVRAFRRMPKEARRSLSERTKELAEVLAESARRAGHAEGRQAALVADLVKARKGQTPFIAGGGAKRVGSRKVPAYKLIFGAEFGANTLKQYKPHAGKTGYWLFPTVEREKAKIIETWKNVADDVAKDFAAGGP